jgi:cephalosporin-C deacetylase-like acetyl esterase
MKKNQYLVVGLCGAVLAVAGHGAEAPTAGSGYVVQVATDRADALYRQGEEVIFKVRLTLDGEPVDGAEVDWTISKDGVAPITSGRLAIREGGATVAVQLDEPGFLHCRVVHQVGGSTRAAAAGAGVDPLAIKPSRLAPADFDEFWMRQKQRLAAVPVVPVLTPVEAGAAKVEAFDLQTACVGAPVSGYLARPSSARPKSLPAILLVHGAGVRSSLLKTATDWAGRGMLALDINAHGLPNGRPAEFYAELEGGELKNYRHRGRESREENYFLGMFLRVIRAIDVLAKQPEWDGRTLVVFGTSQGGAQAIVAAGIDPRVTFFVAGVPAMCDHSGSLVSRVAGWPKFIPSREIVPESLFQEVSYYDMMHFAARTKIPGFFTVGFIDTTCPPTSVFAAYNALPAPKEIFHDIAAGHTNTPAAQMRMRAAVERHVASQASAAPQVTVHANVEYLAPDRAERLDLYFPPGHRSDLRHPAVVWIHGGGWKGGAKTDAREKSVCRDLAIGGYVCASVDYQLGNGAWPQNLLDCKNAVRYLRAHAAELGIDPDRIAVAGGSAGGHLALMVGYTPGIYALEPDAPYPSVSSTVRCVVDMYGITNLHPRPESPPDEAQAARHLAAGARRVFGTATLDTEVFRLASPLFHVSRDTVPTLILHGRIDTIVDYRQSTELAAVLQARAVPHELVLLEGVGHTFDLQSWNKAPLPGDLRPTVLAFLAKHLGVR